MMTREDAIDHVFGLSSRVDMEFCCTGSESKRLNEETRDALRALGVTEREMNDY